MTWLHGYDAFSDYAPSALGPLSWSWSAYQQNATDRHASGRLDWLEMIPFLKSHSESAGPDSESISDGTVVKALAIQSRFIIMRLNDSESVPLK